VGEINADRASGFLFGTSMELIIQIREVHSSNLTDSHVLTAAFFLAVPRTTPHYNNVSIQGRHIKKLYRFRLPAG
jgi:hypothetical protein